MTESQLPTQVRRPWRATVRTVFEALVALDDEGRPVEFFVRNQYA